ncbi:MAG: hypothetical protein HY586_03330 [Candidatus Omnitrophica bacterium]|nr:hypothetical protein [Candidatus Omnitrophota bacterium]
MFFLISVSTHPEMALGNHETLSEANAEKAVRAFNQSINEEVRLKIAQAERAGQAGDAGSVRMLLRQAMLLETLRIDEEKTSEEKLISLQGQMSRDEKKEWIRRFLVEGDRLAGLGLYDLAVEEYEKVFLLEPDHRKASGRIDAAKRNFIKNQKQIWKDEDRWIEEQYQKRTEMLLGQVEQFIGAKNYSSARRLLERLMRLEPRNKRAKELWRKLKEAAP